jgi:hypothetical protein
LAGRYATTTGPPIIAPAIRTLDEAIKKAEAAGTGAYIDIEVVTEKYAASQLAQELHQSVATLYAAE